MGSTLAYPNQLLWGENIYDNYALLSRNPYLLRWTGQRAEAQLWKTVYFLKGVVRKHLWARTLSYLQNRAQNLAQIVECGYDWRESLQDSSKYVIRLVEEETRHKLNA